LPSQLDRLKQASALSTAQPARELVGVGPIEILKSHDIGRSRLMRQRGQFASMCV